MKMKNVSWFLYLYNLILALPIAVIHMQGQPQKCPRMNNLFIIWGLKLDLSCNSIIKYNTKPFLIQFKTSIQYINVFAKLYHCSYWKENLESFLIQCYKFAILLEKMFCTNRMPLNRHLLFYQITCIFCPKCWHNITK